MAGNKLRFDAEMDDKVSGKLGKIGKAFDKSFGKGSSASLFGNIGAKAVGVGFGLMSTAASALTDILGDSVKAAMEEEVSVQKLGTALQANIANWDGNTAAIEKVLEARMALGFSDDEQRQSLALLVASTKDVTLSLDIERTAMDLARLKGISLEEATTALIKTQDGGTRVLKALGITVKDNATQQEILTAVQKAADGQAAAYAQTTSGKLLVAQTKVGEAMEKIGGVIMPALAGVMTAMTDEWLPALGRGWDKVMTALKPIIDVLRGIIYWSGKVIKAIQDVIHQAGGLGPLLTGGVGGGLGNIGHAAGGWVGLRGPELALVGERGPEYITPNHALGRGGTGVTLQGVTEREIVDMVERGMYFRLRRAAPTANRA